MLGKALPHVRTSKKAIAPADLALGFITGILAGAKKLTHVAHLRRDVVLAPLLAIARIGSQSTFTRFFQGFTGPGQNLATFRALWRWGLERLPSRPGGYSLDLDSTRLLHEDGQQEGVKVGYTRLGTKPCLHPLLAIWQASEVPGTDVAEVWHREHGWDRERRVILVRHRIEEKERPGGKQLLEVPGSLFPAFVTNLPVSVPPIEVWRDDNPRAGCEGVIKQLAADFALPDLCVKKFWGTEAAMSLAVLSYNLCVLFQRHLGWLDRVTAATLRFRLFTTGGIISETGGRTTIRLSVPPEQRDWWRAIFEKIVSLYPNCNAVGLRAP